MAKKKGDIRLQLFTVPVQFRTGPAGTARAEGNNAAWQCKCKDQLWLIGRCYFAFGHDCHTVCPTCDRRYRVLRNAKKQTTKVVEL
jgi:hypothetical protein